MRISTRIVAWAVERLLDAPLGALVFLAMAGNSGNDFGDLRSYQADLGFICFFMLTSGYVGTTLIGAILTLPNTLRHIWANTVLLALHGYFFVVLAQGDQFLFLAVSVGIPIASFTGLVGSTMAGGLEIAASGLGRRLSVARRGIVGAKPGAEG